MEVLQLRRLLAVPTAMKMEELVAILLNGELEDVVQVEQVSFGQSSSHWH